MGKRPCLNNRRIMTLIADGIDNVEFLFNLTAQESSKVDVEARMVAEDLYYAFNHNCAAISRAIETLEVTSTCQCANDTSARRATTILDATSACQCTNDASSR